MKDIEISELIINELYSSIPGNFKKFCNPNCAGGQNRTIYHPENIRGGKVRSLFISTTPQKIRIEIDMENEKREYEYTPGEFVFNSQDKEGFPYDIVNLWVDERRKT